MKTLLLTATLLSQLIAGHALAQQNTGEEDLAQCEQEAIKANAESIEDYVLNCIEGKREYEKSE